VPVVCILGVAAPPRMRASCVLTLARARSVQCAFISVSHQIHVDTNREFSRGASRQGKTSEFSVCTICVHSMQQIVCRRWAPRAAARLSRHRAAAPRAAARLSRHRAAAPRAHNMAAADGEDGEKRQCFLCDGAAKAAGGALICASGCACPERTEPAYVHLPCALTTSKLHGQRICFECPTCAEEWTGELAVALAHERWRMASSRKDGETEKLYSALELAQQQWRNGQDAEALAVLAEARDIYRDEHEGDLRAMDRLISVHLEMNDYVPAMPLQAAVLDAMRSTFGPDDQGTLQALASLAATHAALGEHDAALRGMEEALACTRRVYGDASSETLQSLSDLASLRSSMGQSELVVPLLTEALQTSRQLYGSTDPTTLAHTGSLGILLSSLGDLVLAGRLLTLAVAGLGEHPESPEALMHFQSALQENTQRLEETPKGLR
jgi:tetratricopeptide (TPR) repeat protein